MSKALEESSLSGTTLTGSASPQESKKREKTVPHYLRACTGSCHDLCKYGHKKPSEEDLRSSGGRRKKLPTHLNNLALHRSAILDRSKDVSNRSHSLAKSSISLGESERFAPKLTSTNRKVASSSESLIPQIVTSAEQKILKSDGSKKHLMVTEKSATNPRHSNGESRCKKDALSGKMATYSAKLKVPEKALPEKSKTLDKVTTGKHSSVKRQDSSSTETNMIKKVPDTYQTSSHHLVSSKDKITPRRKVASPSAAISRVRAKPGRSPMRSSNANTHGKEDPDTSRSSFSIESKLTASVEVQEELDVIGYSVESIPSQLSLDVTECVENVQPAPEESNKSISDDYTLGNTEKRDALACEPSMECHIATELQQSSDDKNFNAVPHESPEHELAEQSGMDDQALKDEDSQADDASLYRLPDHLTTVENAYVYDLVLTRSNSKIEDDQENMCVESLNADDKEEVGVHENLQRSVEILVIDKKHIKEPDSSIYFAAGSATENDKADKVLHSRTDNCASYCNSISETSSDGELLDKPKSMVTEPSDSTGQIAALPNVNNADSKEGVGVHDDLQRSVEILVLDEKQIEEPESSLHFASGNAGSDKSDEVLDSRTGNFASYCNPISENSSDGKLLEEHKSMIIEPSDSTTQIVLPTVSNENSESEGLKEVIIPLPEELSDDEFYEEYDSEFSESDESGTEHEEAIVNRNMDESVKARNQRPRRTAAPQLDDANATPYKLKFKRGKIVELPPDSNGPRRLKFRRKAANELLYNQSQSARRIYKRSSANNMVLVNPDLESSGVKLRHQDAQEKKDAQGLFNNVIEETASKLVESRKSKVKALVGAFETVISLQDGKPISQDGHSQDSVHGDEGSAPEGCE